jgi:hypothetical protein
VNIGPEIAMERRVVFDRPCGDGKMSPKATGSDSFWTTAAFKSRLAREDGILGVGTQSYGHIKCELDVLDNANNKINISQYDHIVEAGIEVKSGVLQVIDCPNSELELEIKIKPGTYRVRVYSWNLAGTDINEDEGSDRYKIEIWHGNGMDLKVLKQYPGPRNGYAAPKK